MGSPASAPNSADQPTLLAHPNLAFPCGETGPGGPLSSSGSALPSPPLSKPEHPAPAVLSPVTPSIWVPLLADFLLSLETLSSRIWEAPVALSPPTECRPWERWTLPDTHLGPKHMQRLAR